MKTSEARVLDNDKYFNTDHSKTGLKKQAIKGARATVLSRVLAYGIQMIGTIVLARVITPNNFGLTTMVTAFSLLFQNCGMRGFTEAIIQSQDLNHQKVSTLFWLHLGISVGLALFFSALSPVLAWFYNEPRLESIAIVISLSFVFSALSTHHLALLAKKMEFNKISAIEISAVTLSTLVALILGWRGWGYWALAVKVVALPATSAMGAWIACRWRPGRPVADSGIKPMLKFGLHTYGNFSMYYLSRNLDNVLIGWRYSAAALGNYDKAYNLFIMPVNQLTYPLTNVAVSTLSRLRDQPEEFRHYYLKALSMLAFIGMPLSAMLTLIGGDFIRLLLGPQWQEAGRIFSAFGPTVGILLTYGTHGWLHLSLGKPDRWFRWSILEVIITVFSYIIGLPFGATGVAIAYGLSLYILICPGLMYAGKPIDLKLSSILSALWKYCACAIAAGLASGFILYSFALTSGIFLGLNIVARILVSLILCAAIYLLLIQAFCRSTKPISQFISLIKEMAPARFSKS